MSLIQITSPTAAEAAGKHNSPLEGEVAVAAEAHAHAVRGGVAEWKLFARPHPS
jgi:hypothetical protein